MKIKELINNFDISILDPREWSRSIKISAIATLMAIAFVVPGLYCIYMPVDFAANEPVEIVIDKGDGLGVIAQKLTDAEVIRSNLIFTLYVKLRGQENNLKAGKYKFSKSLNLPTIVAYLTAGKSESDDIRILIPEGFNIWEIDERLTNLGLIFEGDFSSRFKDDEGYLFPDTYQLRAVKEKGTFEASEYYANRIREKMSDNFKEKTAEIFSSLSVQKQKEVIIIASMLEKEARSEKDMKLVAGIVYKRLELDMPLQIDATVIYGACRRKAAESDFRKNCDVTFQGPAIEIKIDSIFNTYTRKGLPAAPISSPGLRAIDAALNPEQSPYLYYLSTRDGVMIYSKTPSEHQTNRLKYLGF